jgi:hypothetical protein
MPQNVIISVSKLELAADYASDVIAHESLAVLRAAGRGHVRRRLEVLINSGLLGVVGAQKVYRDAFGGELKAVKIRKPFKLLGWLRGSKTASC